MPKKDIGYTLGILLSLPSTKFLDSELELELEWSPSAALWLPTALEVATMGQMQRTNYPTGSIKYRP